MVIARPVGEACGNRLYDTARLLGFGSATGVGIPGESNGRLSKPDDWTRETASYMLRQGDIKFIVTGAMGPEHPVAEHVLRHGPGVKDVAIAVPDAEAAFELQAQPIVMPEIREILVGIYRYNHLLTQICEHLVDYDEGLQEWRYRHVKMVERTIGTKPGTGGSPGAAYLRKTLFRSAFPDLWAIRAEL